MPPPQAIVCSTCGGKFFEQSYPIHVKKCKEKFAASHTECDQCGLQVNNNDWAMHKQSCKISPRAKKRMQELKARAAKHIKNAAAQQQARSSQEASAAAPAEAKADAHPVAVPAPAAQPTEVPEHCQECSEAACERYCGECEQFLCGACSESLHKKGARARHVVKPLVVASSGAESGEEVNKSQEQPAEKKESGAVAALYANAFDAEADKGDVDREPCRICGRKFANDRLYIHERVCANIETKKKSKKRKVYKGTELRTRGTEFAQFLKKKPETPREIEEWHEQGGRRWRQEAEEFRQIIETNKAMDEMKAAGLLPPDPPKAKLRDTVGMSGLGSESKSAAAGGAGVMKSKGGATFEIDMSAAASAAAAAASHQTKPTARAAATTTRKPKEPAKPDISGAVPLPKPAKAPEPAKKDDAKAPPKPTPVAATPVPAVAAAKPASASKPSNETSTRPPSVPKAPSPTPAQTPAPAPVAAAKPSAPAASPAVAAQETKGVDHNAPRNLQKEKMERARARARVAEEKRRDEQSELPPLPPAAKVKVRSEFTERLIARERGDEALEQLRASKGQKRASSRTGGLRTENVRTVQGRVSAGSPAPAKRNSANSSGRRSASVGRAPSGGAIPRSNSNQNNRAAEAPSRQAPLTRSVSDLHKSAAPSSLPAINRSSSSAALAHPPAATPSPAPGHGAAHSDPHAVAPIVKSSSAVKLPQIASSSSSQSLAHPAPSPAPIVPHHSPSAAPIEAPSTHSQSPVPLAGKPAASMTEYLERERLRRQSAGRERLNKISAAPIPAPSPAPAPAPAPTEKRASATAAPASPVPIPASVARAESLSSLEPAMSSEARSGSTSFDIPLKAEGQPAKSKPKLSSDAPKKKADLVSTNPSIGQAPTRLHATVIDGKVQRILEHPTIPSKSAEPAAAPANASSDGSAASTTASGSESRVPQKEAIAGAQSQVRNARSSFLERVVSQHKLTEEPAGTTAEPPRS